MMRELEKQSGLPHIKIIAPAINILLTSSIDERGLRSDIQETY